MVKLKGTPCGFVACLKCGKTDRPIASTGLCARCAGLPAYLPVPPADWSVQSYSVWHSIQAKGGPATKRQQMGVYPSREAAVEALEQRIAREAKRAGVRISRAANGGYRVRTRMGELHHYSIQMGVRDRSHRSGVR